MSFAAGPYSVEDGRPMSKAQPWSVKGITPDTREAAKEAARKAGMTLGEWINTLVMQSAAGGDEPSADAQAGPAQPAENGKAGAPQATAAGPAERQSTHGPLEARLEHITHRMRVIDESALQADASSVDRLEGEVHELADALQALGTAETSSPQKTVSAWAAIEERLGSIQEQLDGMARLRPQRRPVPAPREAHDAPEMLEQTIAALTQRLSSLEARLDGRADAPAGTPSRNAHGTAGQEPASAALARLEERIQSLATRLDPDALVSKLKAKIAAEQEIGITDEARAMRFDGLCDAVDEVATRQSALERAYRERGISAEIEQRFDQISARLDQALQQNEPDLGALQAQMAELSKVVHEAADKALPNFGELNERLAGLAARLDSALEERDQSKALMEERFEDLSEKLASSLDATRPELAQLDQRLLEIAARLASQPEAGSESRLEQRIEDMSQRLTEQVGQTLPDIAVLDRRLEELGRRIESSLHDAHQDSATLRNLDQRLSRIGERVERALDGPHDEDLLRHLEERLAGFGARIETAMRTGEDVSALGALDERMRQLAERVDRALGRNGPDEATLIAFDDRLEALGERLERSMLHTQPDFAALDLRLSEMRAEIRTSLEGARDRLDPSSLKNIERSIESIGARLEEQSERFLSLHVIERGMSDLFNRVEGAETSAMEAARDAARDAMREAQLANAAPGEAVVEALQRKIDDLKNEAQGSDLRTRNTLGAVHSTLEQIVGRMKALETDLRDEAQSARPNLPHELQAGLAAEPPADRTPQQDQDRSLDVAEPGGEPELTSKPAVYVKGASTKGKGSTDGDAAHLPQGEIPAEPKSRDAAAVPPQENGAGAGLRGWLQRRSETSDESQLEALETALQLSPPALDLDENDVDAHRPLEPGSGNPRSARPAAGARMIDDGGRYDEVHYTPPLNPAASQAEFIAAARRAAQAASAPETDVEAAPQHGRTGARSRMKTPLLAGASVLVLAVGAWQVSQMIGKDDIMAVLPNAPVAAPAAVAPTAPTTTTQVNVAAIAPSDAPRAPGASLSTSTVPIETAAAPAGPAAVLDDTGDMTGSIGPTPPPLRTQADEEVSPDRAQAAAATLPEGAFPDALRNAAAAGDPAAAFEIGARFMTGEGVPQDLTRAATWYGIAAEAGLAPAQFRLGSLYEKGRGVEQDRMRARALYEEAARGGNLRAMHNLAVLLADGAEGTPDYAAAAHWFREAAVRGLSDSQYNLGILSARGLGLEQNLPESYTWFAIAAEAGDTDAAAKRDDLAAHLSPEELASAKRAVQVFSPEPLEETANAVAAPEGGWGVAAGSAPQAPRAAASGTPLADRDAVRRVQALLAQFGFENGPADGLVGPRTVEAVRAYERASGMPETGLLTPALLQRLESQAG